MRFFCLEVNTANTLENYFYCRLKKRKYNIATVNCLRYDVYSCNIKYNNLCLLRCAKAEGNAQVIFSKMLVLTLHLLKWQ